jgi:hypothetical protein
MNSAILKTAGSGQITNTNGVAIVSGFAMIGGGKREMHQAPGAGRRGGERSEM